MTILFEERRLGAAPALIARPPSARPPLPTVLWFHSFTADKATHRPELATLAEAGFLVVGIDYVEIEDSLHLMTPEDWAWSIRESGGWLSRFTA